MPSPTYNITYVPVNVEDIAAAVNDSIREIDGRIVAMITGFEAAVPGSPTDGQAVILTAGAHDNELARWYAEGGYWEYTLPEKIGLVRNLEDGALYAYSEDESPPGWYMIAGVEDAPSDGLEYVRKNGAWVQVTDEVGDAPVNQVIPVAISDEVTDLTTGVAKVTFRMPFAFTLTGVRGSLTTAPSGSTVIVDINQNGSTILSTKLSVDAGEKTSTTAASAVVISDTTLDNDAEITIDIDQIGSSIAGAGLKVYLIGYPTP